MTSPCGTCRVAEHGTVLEKPHPQSTIQLYGLTMVYGKVVRDITHITIVRSYGGWIYVSRFSIALGLAFTLLFAGVRPHRASFQHSMSSSLTPRSPLVGKGVSVHELLSYSSSRATISVLSSPGRCLTRLNSVAACAAAAAAAPAAICAWHDSLRALPAVQDSFLLIELSRCRPG